MSLVPESMDVHVSVENQFPEDLYEAMAAFIRQHPQWDQYRLMQSAVAGFLFQQGCHDPAVVRHYLNGLFRKPLGLDTSTPRVGLSKAQ
jgi:hypothetical protein